MNNPFAIYTDIELTQAVHMYSLSGSKQSAQLRKSAVETLLLRLCHRFAPATTSRSSLMEQVSKELCNLGWDWTPELLERWAIIYSDHELKLD